MITLAKSDEPADLKGVTKMKVGISWDTTGGGKGKLMGMVKRKVGTDLDLICVAKQGNSPVRLAGLDSLDPMQNGSVLHTGDNQTGHGAGDDEQVIVDFAKVPANVTELVFLAAAFKAGSSFENAANISFKLYDCSDGKDTQVADIWPDLLATGNACAVAKAFRDGGEWKLVVLDVTGNVTQGDQKSMLRFCIDK